MRKSILAIALLCGMGANVIHVGHVGLASADDDKNQREIVGQLISIDNNVYLIKDSKGTEQRFKLAADAQVSKAAVPGKQVEVYLSQADEITAVKIKE